MSENNSYERNHEHWLMIGKTFLKCQRTMNKLLSPLDITIAQHEVLLNVYRNEGITHKELTNKLFVVKSNVSNLIKRLEQRNLVSIAKSNKDQRSKQLRLTPNGQELVAKSIAIQKKVVVAMMKDISADDLIATDRVMANASESLDKLA